MASPPPGFVIDTNLPEGFVVDQPEEDRGLGDLGQDAFNFLNEFAASANRSIFELADFLGPNAINDVLALAGREERIPTVTESAAEQGVGVGGFLEEGLARDIAQSSGEAAVAAATAGGIARNIASRIPQAAQSTLAQVGRQLGTGTAATDVAAGIAAGAGGEVGEEIGEAVGGETGAEIGRTAGAIVAPFALQPFQAASRVSQRAVDNMLRKAAPSLPQVKQASDDIYRQIDDLGVTFNARSVSSLADDIERTLVREGVNPGLTPKASSFINQVRAEGQSPRTASQIDTWRKLAGIAARDVDDIGKPTADSRLGTIAIRKIDDFLQTPSPTSFQAPPRGDVGPLFRQARSLVRRRKAGEQIEEAFERASLQQSGFENGLRIQFRSILNSKTRRQGFSDEELDLMRKVVQGGVGENAARLFGKFGLSLDLASGGTLAGITGLGGLIAGGQTGGLAAGAVVGLASAAKQAARTMTSNNAKLADSLVRAGSNGRRIVAAYLRNVPKSQRNTEELTGLLLENNVPLDALNALSRSRTPTVANAGYFASVLSAAESGLDESADEDSQQQN